ncbi:hypothetical protein F7U66_02085 [Vibrio parahaemolyticus]|nr:hypothetical protein [Vibrio parahaemolyticus]
MDTTLERFETVEVTTDLSAFLGHTNRLKRPSESIEKTTTQKQAVIEAVEQQIEIEDRLENTTAAFPASAFCPDYLSKLLLAASQLQDEEVSKALTDLMSENILEADLESFLTVYTNALLERFESRTERIMNETKEALLSDLFKLHTNIDKQRMRDWLTLVFQYTPNSFDVRFNNGMNYHDEGNFEGAALTIMSDYVHLYTVDFENRYEDTALIDVANEAAIGALHAPQTAFYSYHLPIDELVDALKDKKISTLADFDKYQKEIKAALVDTGIFEYEDLEQSDVYEYFLDVHAEIVLVGIKEHSSRTTGVKIAEVFRKHIQNIRGANPYVHSEPTHTLITHPSTFNSICHQLSLGEDEVECSFRIEPLIAEEMLDNVFKNALVMIAIDAYISYDQSVEGYNTSGKTNFKTTNTVEPLPII